MRTPPSEFDVAAVALEVGPDPVERILEAALKRLRVNVLFNRLHDRGLASQSGVQDVGASFRSNANDA